jgi:hypothetical protein
MVRYAIVVLCLSSALASQSYGQKASIEPIHFAAGTVLSFHLHTRLNPENGNETDVLPKGTVLRVRLLDAIDSTVERDGSEFRGAVVSSVVSENGIVVHSESEVRGLLALLRSRNHPEGFRYELLLTKVSDHGKSYDLTASLHPSFVDGGGASEAVRSSAPGSGHEK